MTAALALALRVALGLAAASSGAPAPAPRAPLPVHPAKAASGKGLPVKGGAHDDAHARAVPPLATAPKLLERAEPSLEQGARLLAKGDVDGAIERFRRADPRDPDERAIVEYDVGSAQVARAAEKAKAAAAQQKAKGGPNAPAADGPKGAQGPQIDKQSLDDAKASFDRAFGLAKDPRIKSEAALAAGNAAVQESDLDDAIAQYRKAVVADPTNARAKTNLRRVLDAKRAQPPPPPQKNPSDDDKKNDDDKKKNDQKDQNKDQQKQDQKKQDQKKDQPKNGDDKKQQQQPQPQDQKKQQKKDDAKRLLDAMRARERPMTPLEMRGQVKQQKPKQGKDW